MTQRGTRGGAAASHSSLDDPAARDATVPASYSELLEDSVEDLYENAPCGYLSTLPDGTIVKVNETFLSLTGYGRDELVGRTRFQDLLTAGGRIFHETHYAPLLQMQKAVREIAVEIVCADGRRLPALINSAVKDDLSGRPVLVRTTVFDATDRRAYERELLLARRRAEESEARARVLAETLQASLIPPALPTIRGVDVGAAYRPAGRGDEVGGDFYDVFEVARGDSAIVLGDVCGKGAEAAAVTALARYTVRAAALQARTPRLVLATLNEALLRDRSDRFCTVAYARVRCGSAHTCRVTISSGGHPLPVLVPHGGDPRPLGRAGDLLGVLGEPELHDTSVWLEPGDVVLLYTDGVTEGRGAEGFFGDARLHAVLAAARAEDATAIATRVVDAVVEFQGGSPRDDIAVVALKVPGTPAES
ncbi:MAG TPA: SpoIIE family protein phosphatase [Actinomycetota bacterium]|nr:SpoIIE family protein phosphatase [Actinomycetota bacterium]